MKPFFEILGSVADFSSVPVAFDALHEVLQVPCLLHVSTRLLFARTYDANGKIDPGSRQGYGGKLEERGESSCCSGVEDGLREHLDINQKNSIPKTVAEGRGN